MAARRVAFLTSPWNLWRGKRITDYARELKLPEKIKLFRDVCAAVHYAHQSLVVHRDLKPSNILVNEEGVPKLLDFGIAKLLNPLEEDSDVTRSAFWTPDYASPEQVRARPVTTRTDVYSLGLILFEMLTGAQAQTADTSTPSRWTVRFAKRKLRLRANAHPPAAIVRWPGNWKATWIRSSPPRFARNRIAAMTRSPR